MKFEQGENAIVPWVTVYWLRIVGVTPVMVTSVLGIQSKQTIFGCFDTGLAIMRQPPRIWFWWRLTVVLQKAMALLM
jgi:hypothetical protein